MIAYEAHLVYNQITVQLLLTCEMLQVNTKFTENIQDEAANA